MTASTDITTEPGPALRFVAIALRAPFAIAAALALIYGVYHFTYAREILAIALVAYAVLLWRFPFAWLFVLPAVLPVVNLAMWSGRFFFDEFDFFVLTTLAVNYWRPNAGRVFLRLDGKQYILLYLLAISFAISTVLVLVPFPPIDANAFSSYLSPYNSLRIGKGFLWAFLLAPQLDHAYRTDAKRFMLFAGSGVLAGLAAAGIGFLWEKGVFAAMHDWTSIYGLVDALLDFSGTYRSTGLFSSMHTGGTAIDGYLALATPVALGVIVFVRNPLVRLAACAVFALGLYSITMTFSRGLYAALGLSMAVLALCLAVRYRKTVTGNPLSFLFWALWFTATTAALFGSYKLGGYVSVGGAMAAALLGLLAGFVAGQVSKPIGGLVFLGAIALSAFVTHHGMDSSKWTDIPAQFALTFAVIITVVLGTAAAILGYFSIPKHRAFDVLLLAAILAVIWVGTIPALSGVRMTTRFAAVSMDMLTRDSHWGDVVSIASGEGLHRVFGMGTGSFPRHYFVNKMGKMVLVSYRAARDENGPHLVYGSGDYHITQRISMKPDTMHTFKASVRTRHGSAGLYLKICEKNFIFSERYTPNCVGTLFKLAQSDTYQDISYTFSSETLGRHGLLYWPVTLMFYLGESNPSIDITSVSLTTADGTELVANGDFSRGMDRWLFVSDWEHLAWHEKNTFLHVFFEQGIFGLLIYLSFIALAIARCIRSLKTASPVPVVLLPAILAFLAVGLFGTVIDNPRVAMLLYLMLFAASFPHGRKYLHNQT